MHTAFALSLSTPFHKPLKLFPSPNSNSTSDPTLFKPFRLHFSCNSHYSLISFRNSSSSSFNWGYSNTPISANSFLIHSNHAFKVKAASVPESKSHSQNSDLIRNAQLTAMFGIWYLLNIYFNIFNKQVLKVYPFPATVTAFQFGCGTLMISIMWALNLYPRPNLTRSQVGAIIPLAIVHAMGNILTNVSLGKVAVSFTHTIKAMEPFFTVLFASLFLGQMPSVWVVSSLLPIAGGVALASFTEASFNWTGFCSAMASNVTNQSRNVLSKKLMVNKEEALDNINLFSVITIICFILMAPTAFFLEGINFTPSYFHSAANSGLNFKDLLTKAVITGICFHAYQQVSYMILEMVNPVTHAVGNCVKRVVVIVSSVIIFQTPISPLNSMGTALALAGVFLYSRVKRIKPNPKAS